MLFYVFLFQKGVFQPLYFKKNNIITAITKKSTTFAEYSIKSNNNNYEPKSTR